MREQRWPAEVDAAEIRRRAQADADMVRYEADLYAAERRRDAEHLVEKARAHLLAAEERAVAIEQEARGRAESFVRDTEHRAREAAGGILGEARQWFADAVQQASEARRRSPIVSSDRSGTDVVIDLRPGAHDITVDDVLGPTFDQLDQKLQEAVQRAVRRAFRAPTVAAGRYRD